MQPVPFPQRVQYEPGPRQRSPRPGRVGAVGNRGLHSTHGAVRRPRVGRPGFLPAGEHSLTGLRGAGTLRDVSRAVSLVGRLHVDLRRHASAICAVCR
ncbi:putative leader peptide [Kitasatospora sp. NPDC002040]|uniref:putative leader peptide n=1 Tax=Kitasatospora sp. NPDC002040 TaxID=3154661 RepID=UPI0033304D04